MHCEALHSVLSVLWQPCWLVFAESRQAQQLLGSVYREGPSSSSSLLPLVFEIEFHIHSFDMCCKLLCVKQLHPHLAIVAERVWGLMADLG